ncbi:MAG: right-handed parallel beta-helix repeat-containing protein [Nanoarchaeota archaeon]|nr:right-handed parallel beta-helix repeat-containing protein [Nanoarchaeota archaeon]
MNPRVWLLTILLLIIPFSYAANCGGGTDCQCGDYLTSNHVMDYDLTGCDGHGIRIATAGLILDCNNKQIQGIDYRSTGVDITNSEITVKNCKINKFGTGINIHECNDCEITDNKIYDHDGYAIRLSGSVDSSGVIITGNELYDIDHYTLTIESSNVHGTTIDDNYIHDNPQHGIIIKGNDHVVTNNRLRNNGYGSGHYPGIEASAIGGQHFDNAEISGNTINGEQYKAIYLAGYVTNSEVTDNEITGCRSQGIYLGPHSENVDIIDNHITGGGRSQGYGVDLWSLGPDITFSNNFVCNYMNDVFCHGTGTVVTGSGNTFSVLYNGNGACDGVTYSPCPASCGNTVVEGSEQCDDGNHDNGDGCDAYCRTEACGNGRIDAGEECDDNNVVNGDGCNSQCQTEVLVEICTNGIDDDLDSYIDCYDSDCTSNPACVPDEICNNAYDDDGDGYSDCYDTDCADYPACMDDEICNNGLDDDDDGDEDCDDSDCSSSQYCQDSEICDNDEDDDDDGDTDCDDSDCADLSICDTGLEICDNDEDDDDDGDTDCDDSDCENESICIDPPDYELSCVNGIDDDADGDTDCDDDDCLLVPNCYDFNQTNQTNQSQPNNQSNQSNQSSPPPEDPVFKTIETNLPGITIDVETTNKFPICTLEEKAITNLPKGDALYSIHFINCDIETEAQKIIFTVTANSKEPLIFHKQGATWNSIDLDDVYTHGVSTEVSVVYQGIGDYAVIIPDEEEPDDPVDEDPTEVETGGGMSVWIIIFVIAGVVVLGGTIGFLYLNREHNHKQANPNMITPEVHETVHRSIKSGAKPEKVHNVLAHNGWKPEEVKKVIHTYRNVPNKYQKTPYQTIEKHRADFMDKAFSSDSDKK